MSSYDSSAIKSGSRADWDRAIIELNKLARKPYRDTVASTITSASGTPVVAMTRTINGILADDLIEVTTYVSWSSSDGASAIAVGIYVDGSLVGPQAVSFESGVGTSGQLATLALSAWQENLSGNIVVAVKFNLSLGAGTIYLGSGMMNTYVSKKK